VYAPDARNHVATKTDAANRVTTYTYDADGRTTQISLPPTGGGGGAGGASENLSFDYHVWPPDSSGRQQVMPFIYGAYRIVPSDGTKNTSFCRTYYPDETIQTETNNACGGGSSGVTYNINPEGSRWDMTSGRVPSPVTSPACF
jgi:YD repeat-containing protein